MTLVGLVGLALVSVCVLHPELTGPVIGIVAPVAMGAVSRLTRSEDANANPSSKPDRNGDPPTKVGPAEFWDERWEKTLSKASVRYDRVRLPLSPFLQLVDWLERPKWRRVLVVGCGISTEPALLAWLGYEVIAIDVSAVAIDHLEKNPATRKELASWMRLRPDPSNDENRAFDTEEALAVLGSAPTGSLQLLCVDFRDYAPAEGFDVVYCPWSWQCLDLDGRRELAQRAFAWTVPGGACRIATQNSTKEQSIELDRVFQEAGFFDRRDNNRADDDTRARTRLDAGEKLYDVFRASG